MPHITCGSSPHTRGLHQMAHVQWHSGRIIPAHAGFTLPSPSSQVTYEGSSPHTRGLPATVTSVTASRRIIPAHAGFTTSHGPGQALCPDHPRTRGVYIVIVLASPHTRGSSPHTRGLRPHAGPARRSVRIIPAHAGFTEPLDHRLGGVLDHPRTRGVYPTAVADLEAKSGSSPHTRGLRLHGRLGVGPAPDHPRTRGVYAVVVRYFTGVLRIIPAHAGFTAAIPHAHGRPTDHPRTRGVYCSRPGPPDPARGSSPHTRGLRHGVHVSSSQCGIIPAHAGFTPGRPPPRGSPRDHPRTRGVYDVAQHVAVQLSGSSPHTRGLRYGLTPSPSR